MAIFTANSFITNETHIFTELDPKEDNNDEVTFFGNYHGMPIPAVSMGKPTNTFIFTERKPSIPQKAVSNSFLLSLYLNYDRYIVGNRYDSARKELTTTGNDVGLYHVMMVERNDGTSYFATQKVSDEQYKHKFEVPIGAKKVYTLAASTMLASTISSDGELTEEFVPEASASGARANIISSNIAPKPGGFLATVTTDKPSYVYAFVRTNSTREIIKVVRSKINAVTHTIYIKIQPGDYTIEYAAFGANEAL